jgi:hypothetical protein
MDHDFYAIPPAGERQAEWQAILGTGDARVPIRGVMPYLARLGGRPEPELVYDVALDVLTYAQRESLIYHLAECFDVAPREVRESLPTEGLALRAEGCSVVVYHPQRWMD